MSLAFALFHAGVRITGSSDDEGFALRVAELEMVIASDLRAAGARFAEVCAKAQVASLWLGCRCRQRSEAWSSAELPCAKHASTGERAALSVCAAASFGEDVCSLLGPQLARRAAMWPACERPRVPEVGTDSSRHSRVEHDECPL